MTDHDKFYYPLRELPPLSEVDLDQNPQCHSLKLGSKFGNLKEILFKRRLLASIDQRNYKDLIKDFGEFRDMENQ